LLDWDDTLCPTTWLEECNLFDPAAWTLQAREWLTKHAGEVLQLIRAAQALGAVALVTLGTRPWVHDSLRAFLPEACDEVVQLEVFYASEWPVLPLTALGLETCHLTTQKCLAMRQAMLTLSGGQANAPWDSLISIGDGEIERQAAQELGRECQWRQTLKWTKIVKLKEGSSVSQLTSQLRAVRGRLADLVSHPGHKHIIAT
jgi:hypothetical protein